MGPPGVRRLGVEDYLDRGRAVHKATALLDGLIPGRTLDWASLPGPIRPYVEGWRSFLGEHHPKILAVEAFARSHVYRFFGRCDRVVEIRSRKAVLDIKTGEDEDPLVALQLAAYQRAVGEMGLKVPRRLSIHLNREGGVRVRLHEDPGDFAVFMGALNVFHWRNMHDGF